MSARPALTASVRVQAQRGLRADPDPEWARELVETVAAGMGGPGFHCDGESRLPGLPGRFQLPGR